MTSLADALDALGAPAWREITARRERWKIQTAWRRRFAPNRRDWSGLQLDWDALSDTSRPRNASAEAIVSFEALSPEPLVLAQALDAGPMVAMAEVWKPSYWSLRNAW